MAGRIEVDRRVAGIAIIALIGEHETYTAPDIDRELTQALEDDAAVIVDLTRTDFLDSSAVTVLLRARNAAQERNIRFALVIDDTTGWAVRQLLELTGLMSVFPIVSKRDDAIAGAA